MKSKKWWLIAGVSAIIVAIAAGCFFYFSSWGKVFTKPEYIKEVVVQNENFNDVLDEFLDLTTSYIGTKEDTQKPVFSNVQPTRRSRSEEMGYGSPLPRIDTSTDDDDDGEVLGSDYDLPPFLRDKNF